MFDVLKYYEVALSRPQWQDEPDDQFAVRLAGAVTSPFERQLLLHYRYLPEDNWVVEWLKGGRKPVEMEMNFVVKVAFAMANLADDRGVEKTVPRVFQIQSEGKKGQEIVQILRNEDFSFNDAMAAMRKLGYIVGGSFNGGKSFEEAGGYGKSFPCIHVSDAPFPGIKGWWTTRRHYTTQMVWALPYVEWVAPHVSVS